jgi:hypothetical protein
MPIDLSGKVDSQQIARSTDTRLSASLSGCLTEQGNRIKSNVVAKAFNFSPVYSENNHKRYEL